MTSDKSPANVGNLRNIENIKDRTCPFCPGAVEDEFHFLFECNTYRIPRQNLISPITNSIPGFNLLSIKEKFELVMCKMDINLCKYISNCMEIRFFLDSKPKRHQ